MILVFMMNSLWAQNNPGMETEGLEYLLFEEIPMLSSVSTKSEEKLSDAPASVTAYTSRDIQLYGYYTLRDLAAITPGYSSIPWNGERTLITRGQKYNFENAKHLVLVDGISVNFPLSYAAKAQEELPLYFADRVEFLKGPSSALYGTSAFLGVISLISKNLKENGMEFNSQASMGNDSSTRRFMSSMMTKSDSGQAHLSFGYYEKDASKDYLGTSDQNNNILWDNNKSIFLNSAYKVLNGFFSGLGIGVIYMDKTTGLHESWMGSFTSIDNDVQWRTFCPYLKYEKNITDSISVDGYVKGNYGQESGNFPLDTENNEVFSYEKNIGGYEALVEGKWNMTDQSNILLGVNYDDRHWQDDSYWHIFGENGFSSLPSDTDEPIKTYSPFVQYRQDFEILSGLNLTAGLRSDHAEFGDMSFTQLSPRIALVQKFSDLLNLKLLYGEALRAPTLKEYARNIEAQLQLERYNRNTSMLPSSIDPEVIKTQEVSLNFTPAANMNASVTWFHNEIQDAIVSNFSDNNIEFYENESGKTKGNGFELEAEYSYSNVLKTFANYSWSEMQNEDDFYEADVPVSLFNLGAYYRLPTPFYSSVFLVAKYIDEWRVENEDVQENPDGFTTVDSKLSCGLSSELRVDFQILNLFDEEARYPQQGIEEYPITPRKYLVSLNYEFK